MAIYTEIPASIFAVGKTVIKNLFTLTQQNFINHEDRLASVEALASKKVFWNCPVLGASAFTSATEVSAIRIEAAIDVTDIKLVIFDAVSAGITSGTLEVDVRKSTTLDFTSSTSLTTTNASIDFSTASDYEESANVVLDVSSLSLVEGDYLKFDIVSKPNNLGKFVLYVIGEAS